jgi:DNA primase
MLVPSPAMRKSLENRLKVYAEQLWDPATPAGLTYMESRGLTREVIKDFSVGYVARPLPGDARFAGRVAIPYLTPSGPVSFKFRSLASGEAQKYTKDRNDPNRIFNTRVLTHAHQIVITEGEIDCIAATQCGFDAVGIPGARQWKPEWNRIFYNRQITVLADGDDAGEEFADMIVSKLHGARVIPMPPDEDVNSMLLQKGEDWLREQVCT